AWAAAGGPGGWRARGGARRRLTSGTTAGGGRGAEGWLPPPCRRRGRRRRPGGRGEGGVPSMPPRPATTLWASCALDDPQRAPSPCTSRRHLRRLARRRGARAAEGARLESVCTYPVPRVRIPPSPLDQHSWGPVRCSRAAARSAAPKTPSASSSALALGLHLALRP